MAFEVRETNLSALNPLYKPWEEPTQHRVRNPQPGQPALIQAGRRPSPLSLVNTLRASLSAWRRAGYPGASNTTKRLLTHWFETEHPIQHDTGGVSLFRYHWAQREAIEAFIYLHEVRGIRSVADLLTEFGDESLQLYAKGIKPDEDLWARYCAKLATGVGKTKVMSLAIVWSYFHSLYEPNSPMPRHFVLIAPNLTVYERLKDDFENGAIFYRDPLIPDEWKSDFQMEVILQDEAGGGLMQGAVYLTNIHRLYPSRNQRRKEAESEASIFGPPVARQRVYEVGEELRHRIAQHPALMVLNDEAHHLHDEDLAWNQAIRAIHEESLQRGNRGVQLQLDFSATPKHNDGTYFRHIVCDFPLGEAVDAGIVKVPLLGESDALKEQGDSRTPAHVRFNPHLRLGYARYEKSYEEWSGTRKPILFVMTEDTQSADEIARYLDSDEFPLLKGRVLNIHTQLKGKVKRVQRGGRQVYEFVEDETHMKPEDLRALRQLSRELDQPDSPYRCVVSVLMLREGWDVRNVTVIVPLRPYSAQSNILPEQTLGRGLRRMEPSGYLPETITVVHHPAFRRLYEQELEQEGLDIAYIDIQRPYKQTVTIFVDSANKDVARLEIEIPQVSHSIETTATLEGLSFDEVVETFQGKFRRLPVGQPSPVVYSERHIFTEETVAQFVADSGLFGGAITAISGFVKLLERECRIVNAHSILAPLIERFLSEELFERKVNLYSGKIDHRMSDADVRTAILETFIPLIRSKTVRSRKERQVYSALKVSSWKPYQATSTPERPAVPASRTMFNLVPCDNEFEREFTLFLDRADDVVAFARNAGPQKLMIDYLKPDGTRGFYVPDFIVRTKQKYYLVELKGRVDNLVPYKASSAVEWCRTASQSGSEWEYLYVPYHLFQTQAVATLGDLATLCQHPLKTLLNELKTAQTALPLDEETAKAESERLIERFLEEANATNLPEEVRLLAQQAITLLEFQISSPVFQEYAQPFQTLLRPLDEYAHRILYTHLEPLLPTNHDERLHMFEPDLSQVPPDKRGLYERIQSYLMDNLIYGRSIQRLGTLRACLHHAICKPYPAGGIWKAVEEAFSGERFHQLYNLLDSVVEFRNKRVAHPEQPVTHPDEARAMLKTWLACLQQMVDLV